MDFGKSLLMRMILLHGPSLRAANKGSKIGEEGERKRVLWRRKSTARPLLVHKVTHLRSSSSNKFY